MIKELLTGFLDLVYPPHCLLCQRYISDDLHKTSLCPHCSGKLKENIPPFCIKCSRHMSAPIKHAQCKSCRHNHPHFDFAWCAFHYNAEMKHLIHQYKYRQRTQLRFLFAHLLKRFIAQYSFDMIQFDYVIPIPLFSARLRERGFNQSELIAREIAKYYHIPLNLNQLKRVKNTKFQTQLRQKERWTNIDGAFRIKNSGDLKDKTILLVDDLLTTGATASESALTLKRSGVKRIGVLTVAIA